jgi:hypothetical protein
VRFPLIPVEWLSRKQKTNVAKGAGKKELLYTVGRDVN